MSHIRKALQLPQLLLTCPTDKTVGRRLLSSSRANALVGDTADSHVTPLALLPNAAPRCYLRLHSADTAAKSPHTSEANWR